jgi:hypothetical protein
VTLHLAQSIVIESSGPNLMKKPFGALAVLAPPMPPETIETTPVRPHEGQLISTLKLTARGMGSHTIRQVAVAVAV